MSVQATEVTPVIEATVSEDGQVTVTAALPAPAARVRAALTRRTALAAWLGVQFDRDLTPGMRLSGTVTGTTVAPSVRARQRDHFGKKVSVRVSEPATPLGLTWNHPFTRSTTSTVVAFQLTETGPGRTTLTITESGFTTAPTEGRDDWLQQVQLLRGYLAEA